MGYRDMYDSVLGGHIINSNNSDNMDADVISDVVLISKKKCIGIQIDVDNTDAVGVINIQQCIDIDRTNWVDVTLIDGSTSVAVESGVDLHLLYDLAYLGGRYLRAFYDRTSGNGKIDVYCEVKD